MPHRKPHDRAHATLPDGRHIPRLLRFGAETGVPVLCHAADAVSFLRDLGLDWVDLLGGQVAQAMRLCHPARTGEYSQE